VPKAKPRGQKLTLDYVAKHLSDEGKAYEFVERLRWPDGPVCPHCGSVDRARFLEPRDGARKTRTGKETSRRVWKCAECRKQFSVLIGTVFEDSRIPLSKWLLAMQMLCSAKNGVSAHELARTLEISVKSAWFMSHRLRYALERPVVADRVADKLRGIVEVDEVYIGGKRKGTPRGRPGPESHKTPVVTLVERDGEARSRVMRRVTGENIGAMLSEHVAEEVHLMTDEFGPYLPLGKRFASHETVNHGEQEYSRGNVHVNTAEGFFSQLKRSIDGTHHHVSRQHLHRYLSEFDYRYSTRKVEDGERALRAIKQAEGKRLRDRDPATGGGTT
jgi:transposase-like protein